MKHPFRSLLLTGPLFLLLSLFPSCAFGFGVKVGSLSVRLSDDSLRVSLRLDLGMVVARPWVSYTFTPVLRAPGRIVELPPVLVSGQRRLRFDRRERALSSSGYLREPYCILPGNPRDRRDTVFYSVCIAYSPWMRTASLALMQESKDCCDLELLTVDTLLPILGLADPASDSSGFPESSVLPHTVALPDLRDPPLLWNPPSGVFPVQRWSLGSIPILSRKNTVRGMSPCI